MRLVPPMSAALSAQKDHRAPVRTVPIQPQLYGTSFPHVDSVHAVGGRLHRSPLRSILAPQQPQSRGVAL
jgi:hypothetical protein